MGSGHLASFSQQFVQDATLPGTPANTMQSKGAGFFSTMAGQYFAKGEFGHDNMHPNIGTRHAPVGKDAFAHEAKLERFTGQGVVLDAQRKQAVGAMFAPVQNQTYVSGMPSVSNFLHERTEASTIRNAELPFVQQRERAAEKHVMVLPKCVDELRVAHKSKSSISTPVIPGMGPTRRAEPPTHVQNSRAPRCMESSSVMPSRAAYTARPMDAQVHARDVLRPSEEPGWIPAPVSGTQTGRMTGCWTDAKRRQEHRPADLLNPVVQGIAPGLRDDYGMNAIGTSQPSNKTLIAESAPPLAVPSTPFVHTPRVDEMPCQRASKKELTLEPYRDFSNLNARMPPKLTVMPADKPRITLKQTGLHDLRDMASNIKTSVIRPTVAQVNPLRTTLRETNVHNTYLAGVTRAAKTTATITDDMASRRTHRESMTPVATTRNLRSGILRPSVKGLTYARATHRQSFGATLYTPIAAIASTLGGYLKKLPGVSARGTNRALPQDTRFTGAKSLNRTNLGAPGDRVAAPAITNKQVIASVPQRFGPGIQSAGSKHSTGQALISSGAVVDSRASGPGREIAMDTSNHISAGYMHRPHNDAPGRVGDSTCMPDEMDEGRVPSRAVVHQEPPAAEAVCSTRDKTLNTDNDRLDPASLRVQLKDNPYALQPFSRGSVAQQGG